MITKERIEQIVGHGIRQDTYIFVKRLKQGHAYKDIYKDLDNNRELFGIKKDINLVREKTCRNIIEKIDKIGGWKVELEEEEKVKNNWESKRGIYAISIDDTIIYIGKTYDSFKKRFQSHKYKFNNKENDEYLYRELRIAKEQGKQLHMYPLIILEDVSRRNELHLTEKDLNVMELTLISLYQPRCNIEGVLKPYQMRYR